MRFFLQVDSLGRENNGAAENDGGIFFGKNGTVPRRDLSAAPHPTCGKIRIKVICIVRVTRYAKERWLQHVIMRFDGIDAVSFLGQSKGSAVTGRS